MRKWAASTIVGFSDQLGEAAKKSFFFSGPATKAFTPLGLVAIMNFFPYIKKKFFFP